MNIKFSVECKNSETVRSQQVCSMFDVPAAEKCRIEYDIDFPIDDGTPWNVGLIVGPSGSGKSSVMNHVFGKMPKLKWSADSVVDDFSAALSVEDISSACSAVGFSTIPAWLRPFKVLSNGEQFRVDLARRLAELPDPIVVDEFSSVIDRQVAKIGAFAVQKFIRKNNRKFVAVGCHYDVADWLLPDWILDMSARSFARRSLQRRPELNIAISRVPYSAWRLFAPFHYLTGDLHVAARCFGLFVDGRIASFAGILPKPISNGAEAGTAIAGVSRVVTLPDWQGLGLAFVLLEKLGAAYKAIGKRFRNYPAHPGFVASHRKSAAWQETKQAGTFSTVSGLKNNRQNGGWGGRPCGVFEYIGPAIARDDAENLLAVI